MDTQFRIIALVFICLAMVSHAMADIGSVSGNVYFNMNNDGSREMVLSPTGLGVGVTNPSANLHVAGNAILGDNLFIGSTAGNNTLHIANTVEMLPLSVSSNTTIDASESLIFVNSSSSNVTLTLPYAGNCTGRQYFIKKTSNSNAVYIKSGGNIYIDNYGKIIELTRADAGYPFVELLSGGSQWYVINVSGNGFGTVGSTNLVCWLPMDELSGNIAYDYSANLNNGYLTSGTFASNAITGVIGRCVKLDNNAFVNVQVRAASIPFGARRRSVSLWAKPYDSTVWSIDNNFLFSYGTKTTRTFFGLDMHTSPNLQFVAYGDDDVFDAGLSDTGAWFHILTTYDGVTTAKTYVNGTLKVTSSFGAALATASSNLSVGTSLAASGNYFYGNIDDFRLYNKVLTDEEIMKLYEMGL